MPVALLNELVLLGLGLYLGYKGGTKKSELVKFFNDKGIYTIKDFLIRKKKEGKSC